MHQNVALSILASTVALSMARPRIGAFRVQAPQAALLGALLTLLAGLAEPAAALRTLRFLLLPFLTIVSLMVLTQTADRTGLLEALSERLVRAGRGDGRRLFLLLFVAGAVTGALFTNDAAVLLFTPLALRIVDRVQGEGWTDANRIPYCFCALYVANLVGPFVISNPINLIVATRLRIGFLEYAGWMILPALVSGAVTFLGLRFFFRRRIPSSYRIPEGECAPARRGPLFLGAALLGVTLLAFVAEGSLPFPPAFVAAGAAAVALMLHCAAARESPMPVLRGVAWELLLFVSGVFIVALGLKNVGITRHIAEGILSARWLGDGAPVSGPMLATGLIAAGSSALMNNHPVAGLMTMVFDDLPLTPLGSRLVPMCALIGGDLGPKMLPIGSLAALLWFRRLRERGVHASYVEYVKVGVPVTLAAVLVAVFVLRVELWFFLRYLVSRA